MEHPLITVDQVPEDGAVSVDFFGREVLVYREGDSVRASANVCPHLGGPLEACGQEFVCQWHGARFSRTSGDRISGPAPADSRLMHLPTKLIGNTLTYIWKD